MRILAGWNHACLQNVYPVTLTSTEADAHHAIRSARSLTRSSAAADFPVSSRRSRAVGLTSLERRVVDQHDDAICLHVSYAHKIELSN